MLYSIFWVISRLLCFIYRPLKTLHLFHLYRPCKLEELFLLTPPMNMEQIECPKTSAYKIQTPGNRPKERIQQVFNSLTWANFSYSGTTVTNNNCIYKEIKCILNSGNARYSLAQNHLSSFFPI
jgi:hypothetical protein